MKNKLAGMFRFNSKGEKFGLMDRTLVVTKGKGMVLIANLYKSTEIGWMKLSNVINKKVFRGEQATMGNVLKEFGLFSK